MACAMDLHPLNDTGRNTSLPCAFTYKSQRSLTGNSVKQRVRKHQNKVLPMAQSKLLSKLAFVHASLCGA